MYKFICVAVCQELNLTCSLCESKVYMLWCKSEMKKKTKKSATSFDAVHLYLLYLFKGNSDRYYISCRARDMKQSRTTIVGQ